MPLPTRSYGKVFLIGPGATPDGGPAMSQTSFDKVRWGARGAGRGSCLARAWAALTASRRSRAEARQSEESAQRHLQGALAIDPSLPEVHHALLAGYQKMKALA